MNTIFPGLIFDAYGIIIFMCMVIIPYQPCVHKAGTDDDWLLLFLFFFLHYITKQWWQSET